MLISLAVDYRHADLATRERLHLTAARLDRLYAQADDALELLAIATCNRSEVYASIPSADASAANAAYRRLARAWMGDVGASGAARLLAVGTRRERTDAARHLFRVAAGIESQVLGDGQLLGQLREAYIDAGARRGPRAVVRRLAEHALHVGRRVRHETALASGRHSVGAEAARIAVARFGGSIARARVVVVGCGRTGERIARQLVKLGVRDLVLVNRTPEKAERLATALHARTAPMRDLFGELAVADVALFATASTDAVVRADPLATARRMCATDRYPLLLVDVSMPRNVDPGVAHIPGLVVVDLDAMRPALSADESERRDAVPLAEAVVEEELRAFATWLAAAPVRDALGPLRRELREICRREVAYAPGDPARTVEDTADRIVAKLLARPMIELRGAVLRGEPVDDLVAVLTRLFPSPALGVERAPIGGD